MRNIASDTRDLSLGFESSEKSEGTLSVEYGHSDAIPGVSATPKRPQDRLLEILKKYLASHWMRPSADPLGTCASPR